MPKNLVAFLVFERHEQGARPAWYTEDYLEQLAICLASLQRTSDLATFDVLFIADRPSAARIEALPELRGFTHHTRLFAPPPDLCLAMCTRYMIHPILGASLDRYERVLYLDADVVLLRSVEHLFERVTDPTRLYVKPDHWGGTRVDSRWFSLGDHTPEEAERFERERVLVWNSGQFAFVNGAPMRRLFADLCAALPSLIPRSRGLDQPVMNTFLRRRHLVAPCLEQEALDPLVHLAAEEQPPVTPETVLVHFIQSNKLARMRSATGAMRARTDTPWLSFVTTCRGRLAHLKETLPALVAQPGTETIVVDYGCPDGAGDWVEEHVPDARVVRAGSPPRFEVARARNLGAAAARAPWICFVDADVRVAPGFAATLLPIVTSGHYLHAVPRDLETWGTSISARADFERIGGYDEVIQGWGKEDDDYYARLELAGVRPLGFPGALIGAISHSDPDRVAHYDVKDRWLSESVNHVYCRAKIDLSLLRGAPLSLETRRQMYDQVRATVLESHRSGEPAQISLVLPTQETRLCGPIEARLVYTLPRPRGTGHPSPHAASLTPSSQGPKPPA